MPRLVSAKDKLRICGFCCKPFSSFPCLQRIYCSNKCRGLDRIVQKTFICNNCGKIYFMGPSQIKRGNRETCSRHCKGKLQTRRAIAEFWDGVTTARDGCWVWNGAKRTKFSYGVFSIKHQNHQAHRIAWELVNGSIPDGLFVLHKCDNPPCVNPEHLFLGTHIDNMRDMVKKGRAKQCQKKLGN